MKILTLREFRANLSQYLKELEGGEELEVNGVKLQACTHWNDEDVNTEEMCTKCETFRAGGKTWYEGEEMAICINCAKKYKVKII